MLFYALFIRFSFCLYSPDIIQNGNLVVRNGSVHLTTQTNVSLLDGVMTELVLYYNSYLISRNSTDNYMGDSASLVATAYGLSGYKVRYEQFLVIPQNNLCEEFLLEGLSGYPVFKTAHFPKGNTSFKSLY